MSDIIYKYTDQQGARKILSSCTLLFKRPSEMNDPFDVYIDDLFGMDFQEFAEESSKAIVYDMQSDAGLISKRFGLTPNEAEKASSILKNLSEQQKVELLNILREESASDPELIQIGIEQELYRDLLASEFRNYGIFCATKNHNNILMWAHYAEQHKGAVLGFKPNLKKDSYLRLLEPVAYSDERPNLLESTKDWLSRSDTETPTELAEKVFKRVLLTKSPQWSYEEELRLAVPNWHGIQNFIPDDLVEIHLGYRMAAETRSTLIALAKKLNPDVQIYSVALAKRKYSLESQIFLQNEKAAGI